MSGIAGIYHTDGKPADRDVLGKMIGAMPHRGSVTTSFPATFLALAHFSRTSQQLRQAGNRHATHSNGRFTLAGDIRLDNRSALCARLAVTETDVTSDLKIVGELLDQYGPAILEQIDGDFALAVFDAETRILHGCRDHFGVRPFYYAYTDRAFIFASEIKSVLASGFVSSTSDVVRLEDYLVGRLADEEGTFFRDVRRLPGGHVCTVDADGLNVRRYWQLDRAARVEGTEDEMIEGFRERFIDAVRTRVGATGSSASLLSGGLDSSSVTAVAADLVPDLHAYSVTFPYLTGTDKSRSDESQYADEVARHCGIDVSRLSGDRATPLGTLTEMLEIHDQPFEIPNAYLDAIALDAVASDGRNVLLTGLEGDLTISHGDRLLFEMVYAGDLEGYERESRALAGRTGTEAELFFERYAAPALELLASNARWGPFGTGIRFFAGIRNTSPASLAWAHGIRPRIRSVYRRLSQNETIDLESQLKFIRKDYSGLSGIVDRIRQSDRPIEDAKTQHATHLAQLQSGYASSLLEFAEKNAARYGIDVRHPFFDRRLVEYSVGLPGDLKLRNGWPRYILRMAMERKLPDKVRWRADKAVLAPNFRHLMRLESEDSISRLAAAATEAYPKVVDKTSVNNLLERQKYATLWKILVLGAWVLHKQS